MLVSGTFDMSRFRVPDLAKLFASNELRYMARHFWALEALFCLQNGQCKRIEGARNN